MRRARELFVIFFCLCGLSEKVFSGFSPQYFEAIDLPQGEAALPEGTAVDGEDENGVVAIDNDVSVDDTDAFPAIKFLIKNPEDEDAYNRLMGNIFIYDDNPPEIESLKSVFFLLVNDMLNPGVCEQFLKHPTPLEKLVDIHTLSELDYAAYYQENAEYLDPIFNVVQRYSNIEKEAFLKICTKTTFLVELKFNCFAGDLNYIDHLSDHSCIFYVVLLHKNSWNKTRLATQGNPLSDAFGAIISAWGTLAQDRQLCDQFFSALSTIDSPLNETPRRVLRETLANNSLSQETWLSLMIFSYVFHQGRVDKTDENKQALEDLKAYIENRLGDI